MSKFQKIKFNEEEFDADFLIKETEIQRKIHKAEIENFFVKKQNQIKSFLFYLKNFSFKFIGWNFPVENLLDFVYLKEKKILRNLSENSKEIILFDYGRFFITDVRKNLFGLLLNIKSMFFRFCGFSFKKKALVCLVFYLISYLILVLSKGLYYYNDYGNNKTIRFDNEFMIDY